MNAIETLFHLVGISVITSLVIILLLVIWVDGSEEVKDFEYYKQEQVERENLVKDLSENTKELVELVREMHQEVTYYRVSYQDEYRKMKINKEK